MLIHIRVFGRVQGVGFRAWTRRTANSFGISGWVRNRRDGSVEIMADGPDAIMKEFLSACRKGPSWARVDRLEPVSILDAPILPIEQGIFQNQPTV